MNGHWGARALVLGCALLAACDRPPAVLYTANGAAFNVISLTDTQGDCQGAAQVAYLTLWGAEHLKGCWTRERGEVVGRFPGLEERIPVGEFQPTEAAEYRGARLR